MIKAQKFIYYFKSRLNNIELDYLVNRGIKKDTIEKWNLSGLSSISNYQDLIWEN